MAYSKFFKKVYAFKIEILARENLKKVQKIIFVTIKFLLIKKQILIV